MSDDAETRNILMTKIKEMYYWNTHTYGRSYMISKNMQRLMICGKPGPNVWLVMTGFHLLEIILVIVMLASPRWVELKDSVCLKGRSLINTYLARTKDKLTLIK